MPEPQPPQAARRATFLDAAAFRWVCVYFGIYFADTLLSAVVPLGLGYTVVSSARVWWRGIVNWVSEHVFCHVVTVWPAGSGDTTFNYVEVFTIACIATLAAAVWTACDWRRRSYPWLADALRMYVRFSVGVIMVGYGYAKVFPGQFPEPEVLRLMQPYGTSSPMGLLWTFMGASQAYTAFAGAAEVLGGVLLMFRRTALLGALVTAGVMVNVAMLNFCYDVPVKLFSSHLVLACAYLMAPDLGRLANMLVLNRPVQPKDLGPPWRSRWVRWTMTGCKLAVVAWVVGLGAWNGYSNTSEWGAWMDRDPMDGTYMVSEFKRGGEAVPPLETDATRWKSLTLRSGPAFESEGVRVRQMRWVVINAMDGSQSFAHLPSVPADLPATGTLTLEPTGRPGRGTTGGSGTSGAQPDAPPLLGTLDYALTPDGSLTLAGTFKGQRIDVTLKRKNREDYLLVNRGFRWINETPFNR